MIATINKLLSTNHSRHKYCVINLAIAFFLTTSDSLEANYQKEQKKPLLQKTVLISIPKSGTHLLKKCVSLLTEKAWQDAAPDFFHFDTLNSKKLDDVQAILVGHFFALPEYLNLLTIKKAKCLFIMRDPRDQLTSLVHWIKREKVEWIWGKLWAMTPDDILSILLERTAYALLHSRFFKFDGISDLQNIRDLYNLYLPWMNIQTVYTTTFEKLVGPSGGGSRKAQLQEIHNIANHIGETNITDHEIEHIANNLFGQTATFRKGIIGSWKTMFNDKNKIIFKKIMGDLLIKLGYENDNNW